MTVISKNIRVMALCGKTFLDQGPLSKWAKGRATIGPSIGPDAKQAADDRWPVYDDEERIGTLFDDASGQVVKLVDDTGEPIFSGV